MSRSSVNQVARHSAGRLSALSLAFIVLSGAIAFAADDTPSAAPASGVPPTAAPPTPAAAMETLTKKGLTKLKPTATSIGWVVEDEAKVLPKLEAFRKAELAHRTAAQKAKTDSVGTAKDRDALAKAQARYEQEKGYNEKPETIPPAIAKKFHSEQEMKQALVEDLNEQVATIQRLQPKLNGKFAGAMAPSLKTAIIDWMNARNELIVAYLAVEPDFTALAQEYKDLAADPEVAAALKVLGKKHRLGSKDFEQDQRAMAAAESSAMSGEIPFYREGLSDCIGGLLNDTTPVVVTMQTNNPQSPNWAPTDVLTKAGIVVDPKSPTLTLTFTGNGKRMIQCHQVIVPKLRFGKFELENLKFLAMPDDAKDLGFQLVAKELNAYEMTPDTTTWLFKLVKKEVPKPDDDKPAATDDDKAKADADKDAKPDAAKPDADKDAKPDADKADKDAKLDEGK